MPITLATSKFKKLQIAFILFFVIGIFFEIHMEFPLISRILHYARPSFVFAPNNIVTVQPGFLPIQNSPDSEGWMVVALGYKGEIISHDSNILVGDNKMLVNEVGLFKKRICTQYICGQFKLDKLNQYLNSCIKLTSSYFHAVCLSKKYQAIIFFEGNEDDFSHYKNQLASLIEQL